MSTIARNNLIREVSRKSLFESMKPVISTAVNANQGDMVAFDATNHIIKAVTGSGQSANMLGVMAVTLVNGIVPSPYVTAVDASAAIEDDAGPMYGVVCSMTLVAGDVWNPGDKAYLSAQDAQSLTSTAAGSHVAIYQGPAIASAVAGQLGEFLIGARYTSSDINF